MNFICSGQNQKGFEILYQSVSSRGDGFLFFSDGLALLKKAASANPGRTIILLDYDLYKGFIDFIFHILKLKNREIPMILIGGKTEDCRERVCCWVAENEFQYGVQNMQPMIPLFEKISFVLEEDRFRNLFFEKKSNFTNENISLKITKESFLDALRRKSDMPPAVFNLLSFFYKNRSREVSIEEVALHLNIENESEKIRKSIAYSNISRLRKTMEMCVISDITLLRTRTGFYKLFLK